MMMKLCYADAKLFAFHCYTTCTSTLNHDLCATLMEEVTEISCIFKLAKVGLTSVNGEAGEAWEKYYAFIAS